MNISNLTNIKSSVAVLYSPIYKNNDSLSGFYFCFLEAINEGSGVVENMKTVVVVGRKL